MFTSATERRAVRIAFVYLLVTTLCALAGCVYEVFSHGVWSGFMVYAFAFPMMLGAVPFGWIALTGRSLPHRWALRLHHAGVATLTLGSFMEGVMMIYGTANPLTMIYWIVGAMLILDSAVVSVIHRKHR